MANSWKLTGFGDKPTIRAALAAQEEALDWDYEVVLTGFELADDRPDEWRLDAYFPRRPDKADRAMVAALFSDGAPDLVAERLPDEDWITESQKGVEPIDAGCFHVHTPDYPPSDTDGIRSLVIPASQAFGTGHHATTAGCLEMLSEMKKRGTVARDIADIGTGTGLLAFAAMHLWPSARATASDIDPVCLDVILRNMDENAIPLGAGPAELTVAIADGMEDPLLQSRGPYDLLIANILAAPLIQLAPDFAAAVPPRGSIVLAGLLETQEASVRRAYRKAGFRLAARLVNGDWSILWLRRRSAR